MSEAGATSRSYPKGERRRSEIVRAAFGAFSTVGYRNASMVQIAATVGVSRAGLLHHFPSKESLLAAVLQERDRVNASLFWDDFDATDGVEYFARLVRTIEHNASTPGAVGLYAILAAEASDPDHPAHDFFIERYTWLRRELREAFADVASRGLLRDGVDPDGLEHDVIALMDGLQVQWLLDPTSVDMAARLRTRLQDLLTVPLP